MINFVLCFPISRSSSVFMNSVMWEYCTRDRIFDVAVFTIITPLSLPISCKLSFLTIGLKISSSLLFHCNLQITFSCGTLEIDWIHALLPHKSYPSYHHFYLQLMHTNSEQYHTNDLTLLNSTLLTSDIIPLCIKGLSQRKVYNCLLAVRAKL